MDTKQNVPESVGVAACVEPVRIVTGVYVAGTSADLFRAEAAIGALERAGVRVTSTWPIVVRDRDGIANPRDATILDRARISARCLREVTEADLLWLLVPREPVTTRGAWTELGYALARGLTVILSGDTRQSVFSALGYEYATDEEALALILRIAERDEEHGDGR